MRRSIVIAAGLGLVLVAGGAAAWRLLHHAARPACIVPDHELTGVWDAAIKQKVHAAFVATKKAYAEGAAGAVTKALDDYVAEWTTATTANCKDTQQTERVAEIRQLCLDRRFEEVRALAEMLQDPSAALVEKADKAVWELDTVATCASHSPVTRMEVEPRYRADYRRLMLQTAAAHAQAIGGQLVAAEGALMHAADEGKRIHADDLVALALHDRAAVLFGENRLDEAYQVASDAVWMALQAGRDDLVIASAFAVASARAEGAEHGDVADGWIELATAAAVRSGVLSPAFDEQRLELVGVIAAQRGDLKTAVVSHEQAFAAAKLLRGDNSPQLWSTEVQLATTLARSGAWVEALPHFEHARQLREASVGPDHPDVALILSNLGPCYAHAGKTDLALATAKRALEIREKTYGPNSPFLVATLDNLADFEMRARDFPDALADIDRAQTIAIRFPGPTNAAYHTVATTHAEVLAATGRVTEARKAFDEVLALEEANKSTELGMTLASRATLELAQARWQDAAAFEERSIAAYETSGGSDELSLWKPLSGLAQARRALDPRADVIPLLDRALAIGIKAQLTADELDPIRAQRAKL